MNRMGVLVMLSLVLLISINGYSQDKIYLASGSKQGKILDITQYVVTYLATSKKEPLSIPLQKVLLLFNEKGGYLVPGRMNLTDEKDKQVVKLFLSQSSSQWATDKVYKTDKTTAEGTITSEKNNKIVVTTKKETVTFPKKSVGVVIYRDGRHWINGSVTSSADLLAAQGAFAGLPAPPEVVEPKTVAVQQKEITPTVVDTPKETKPLVIDDLIAGISKKDFEERAKLKTRAFGEYLAVLCNKKNPSAQLNKALELALNLFVDKKAIVEVSSATRENTKRRTIAVYLNEVRSLPYDKIEIEWTNVQYVDAVKLAPDGTYRGSVTFEQKFSGFRDNVLIYKDITKKTAEVILRAHEKVEEGRQIKDWDVLLGDIGVMQTTALTN